MRRPSTRSRRVGALLALVGIGAASLLNAPASAEAPVPGSQGIDTSLAATDSALTVSGRGDFADLRITVNQTKDLVNQAVSVTWTGGQPTISGGIRFRGNYLQLMQCWGDDDGTNAANPGPPPEQCVQGASDGVPEGRSSTLFPGGGHALDRVISQADWPNFDPSAGYLDPRTNYVWRPFRAVDGSVVNAHTDPEFNPAAEGASYWLNPFFNHITTNEIPGGRTGANGTGAELFEVTTGLESSGLGCGQKVQPVPGGAPKAPKCWLVVVPRSTPEVENRGTGMDPNRGTWSSPLSPAAWANRIAIPLEFTPLDSSCELEDEQRRISGNELPVAAVSSWQQELCTVADLPPFAYGTIGDAAARQQLLSGVQGTPGMVVVSRPYDSATEDPTNPVVYAPISLSATVIGFNVERVPRVATANPEAEALRGVRVAQLNLTPRLVAKLLTQSYKSQTSFGSTPPPYDWVTENPRDLGVDPDFLQFNPEFELLENAGKNFGGLVLPARTSDAAQQLWEWILSDPEARDWLAGNPDEFGMQVNPVYATNASNNTTGTAFADPIPDQFPKSDPYCFQAPGQGPGGTVIPPLYCGTDWLPYAQSLRDAARLTRAADDTSKTLDPLAVTVDKAYRAAGPQLLGSRTILSLTDSASAHQYGIQTARLSRAGDNGDERRFIAADEAGLHAGIAAMKPKGDPSVLEPDPGADEPNAYPLTALTYAAVAPLAIDAAARTDYAAFLEYAGGAGQQPGTKLGQLPPGYAPLPEELRAQTIAAAKEVRELAAPALPGEDTPTTTPVTDAGTGQLFDPTSFPASSSADLPRSTQEQLPADFGSVTPVQTPAATPAASRIMTPILALAGNRFVLPGLAGLALLSGLGVVEITKRPRRLPASATTEPGPTP